MTPSSPRITTIKRICAATAAGKMPVIFNGAEPRKLGEVSLDASTDVWRNAVDSMLFANRLSATFISRARTEENGALFVVAHG